MKKLIVALVVSCTALMQAQNTVSGRITDTNNKALSGVSIYIQDLQKGPFQTKTEPIICRIYLRVLLGFPSL